MGGARRIHCIQWRGDKGVLRGGRELSRILASTRNIPASMPPAASTGPVDSSCWSCSLAPCRTALQSGQFTTSSTHLPSELVVGPRDLLGGVDVDFRWTPRKHAVPKAIIWAEQPRGKN